MRDSPTASAGVPTTQAKSAGLAALSDGGEWGDREIEKRS